ncbi:hypothetical protein [Streptomyces sp. ODS05-4]|uniref:hypothetical protein n=1 Tax=Streptomyces sp. ODS05-4 TaxID=2944939 RepID=UPI00210B2C36|nr:hypothetical protein [Streptomyces sp. ODS05-4]
MNDRTGWRRISLVIAAAITLAQAPGAAADTTADRPAGSRPTSVAGTTDCGWGSASCTPCVNDVVTSVKTGLRERGDTMGFHLGAGVPAPQWSLTNLHDHWQGVQRLNADNGRWMAVSYDDTGDGPGGVGLVHLGSRAPAEPGGRLRSNRQGPLMAERQAPPPLDAVVGRIDSGRADLAHAGGMSALGDYLAVPFEGDAAESEVRVYSVADPSHPVLKSTVKRPATGAAGNVGWARLSDGRYLLAVGGRDSSPLDFYTSSSIDGEYTKVGAWQGSLPAYQNTNLVTDCATGGLYLLGSHKNWSGQDWLDAYTVDLSGSAPRLAKVANRHLTCTQVDERQCDFAAGGGAYVSAAGELFFYATEHDDDGPGGTVKLAEFRTNRSHPRTCGTDQNSAWVELYEHSGFGGRSVIIDFADRNAEDYGFYPATEAFNDKASSARWCLPPGTTHQLFADGRFAGSSTVLSGIGEDADLAASPGLRGWGDKISSSRY